MEIDKAKSPMAILKAQEESMKENSKKEKVRYSKNGVLGIALAAVLIAGGCSMVPLSFGIDPGDLKSGSQSFDLGFGVKSLDARISSQELTFTPPSVGLTYAEGLVKAKLSITTPEGIKGNIKVQAYIAPMPSTGKCSPNEAYKTTYMIGEVNIPVGVASDVSFKGVLSSEAVSGVNRGALCFGMSFAGNFEDYVSSATVNWNINYIQIGVGVL